MGFLSRALSPQALSPENPANPLQPGNWLALMDGMEGIGSGEAPNVSPKSAMRVAAVRACVSVLSETMGSMPLNIYQALGRGKRLATEHRLYSVLHNAWNSQMTSTVAVQAIQAQAAMTGNGYALIQRDGANRPVALWPLPADKMYARRKDGVLEYMYVPDEGTGQIFQSADILYIPFLSFDGLTAHNPIAEMRSVIGLTIAAQDFGWKFFSRGSRPSGLLTHPNKLTKEAEHNLKQSWQQATSGNNALGVAVLEEGMTFTPLTINPNDAQFMELRAFQLEEVARMWRIPPHMIGILARSTNNNIEQQAREFIQYTMLPWVTKWEQELNRKLFAGTSYYVKFDFDGLLRGDFAARATGIQVLRNSGVYTANDGRSVMDLDPVSAEDGGDILLAPLNMVPLAELSKESSIAEGKPNTESGEGGALESSGAQKLIARGFARQFADATGRTLNRDKKDAAYCYRVWEPILGGLAEAIAECSGAGHVPEDVGEFIRGYTATLAHRSAEWKASDRGAIAASEFDRAYQALAARV